MKNNEINTANKYEVVWAYTNHIISKGDTSRILIIIIIINYKFYIKFKITKTL